jgi:uncharacterized protein
MGAIGMNRTFKAAVAAVIFATGFAGSVAAESAFSNGLEAYRKGDYATAASWYRKAAEQGDPAAQDALGNMYETGLGVPRDYAAAARWYRKVAEADPELPVSLVQGFAQCSLAQLYERGQGVPQDYVLAHMWYNLATAGGLNCEAERELVAAKMTPAQIAEAQKLAREWKPK